MVEALLASVETSVAGAEGNPFRPAPVPAALHQILGRRRGTRTDQGIENRLPSAEARQMPVCNLATSVAAFYREADLRAARGVRSVATGGEVHGEQLPESLRPRRRKAA